MCISAAIIGGSLIGGLVQSKSADKAVKAQTGAATNAANAQTRAANLATQKQVHYANDAISSLRIGREQTEKFLKAARDNQTRQADSTLQNQLRVLSPYASATAQDAYKYELGIGNKPASYGGFEAGPGYQFRVDEGMRALESTKASQGLLHSGAAMKEALRLGTGYANQEYDNHLNRLGDLAGRSQQTAGAMADAYGNHGTARYNALGTFGLASANNQNNYYNNSAQTRTNLGNSLANSYMGVGNAQAAAYQSIGNAQAAGAVASGNAFSSGINNALGGYMYAQANPSAQAASQSSFTGLY